MRYDSFCAMPSCASLIDMLYIVLVESCGSRLCHIDFNPSRSHKLDEHTTLDGSLQGSIHDCGHKR